MQFKTSNKNKNETTTEDHQPPHARHHEILRNIIAERVLGLPADIRVDKNVPFNKVPGQRAS